MSTNYNRMIGALNIQVHPDMCRVALNYDIVCPHGMFEGSMFTGHSCSTCAVVIISLDL